MISRAKKSKWQRELAIQAKLRAQIKEQTRAHEALVRERVKVLAQGGKGWVSALARTNIGIDQSWERLRVLLFKLYSRKPV